MIYWLNRRAEMAWETYLASILPGTLRVYRSRDLTPRQFPCVVARVDSQRRQPGELYAGLRMGVRLCAMHEYADAIDASGDVQERVEEIEEGHCSELIAAVMRSDLADVLTAAGVPGITIHDAQPGDSDGNLTDSDEDGSISREYVFARMWAGAAEL